MNPHRGLVGDSQFGTLTGHPSDQENSENPGPPPAWPSRDSKKATWEPQNPWGSFHEASGGLPQALWESQHRLFVGKFPIWDPNWPSLRPGKFGKPRTSPRPAFEKSSLDGEASMKLLGDSQQPFGSPRPGPSSSGDSKKGNACGACVCRSRNSLRARVNLTAPNAQAPCPMLSR